MLNLKDNQQLINTDLNTKCEIKSTKGTKNMKDRLIYTTNTSTGNTSTHIFTNSWLKPKIVTDMNVEIKPKHVME